MDRRVASPAGAGARVTQLTDGIVTLAPARLEGTLRERLRVAGEWHDAYVYGVVAS